MSPDLLQAWHILIVLVGWAMWVHTRVVAPLHKRLAELETAQAVTDSKLKHGDAAFTELRKAIEENNALIRAHEAGCHTWREQMLQRLPPPQGG